VQFTLRLLGSEVFSVEIGSQPPVEDVLAALGIETELADEDESQPFGFAPNVDV
jgi:hypothetical protein